MDPVTYWECSMFNALSFSVFPFPAVMTLMSRIAIDNWMAVCCPWYIPYRTDVPENNEVRLDV